MLPLIRGDIVHVISTRAKDKGWWKGWLNGRVRLIFSLHFYFQFLFTNLKFWHSIARRFTKVFRENFLNKLKSFQLSLLVASPGVLILAKELAKSYATETYVLSFFLILDRIFPPSFRYSAAVIASCFVISYVHK